MELRDLSRLLMNGPESLIGPRGDRAKIPAPLHNLIKEIVRHLEEGRSLVLLQQDQELTTQRAAQILGMSRPFFIRLLDAGELPYHRTGKHRRVALRDVLTFAARRDERRAALQRMAKDEFASGFYDTDPIPDGGSDE